MFVQSRLRNHPGKSDRPCPEDAIFYVGVTAHRFIRGPLCRTKTIRTPLGPAIPITESCDYLISTDACRRGRQKIQCFECAALAVGFHGLCDAMPLLHSHFFDFTLTIKPRLRLG